MVPGSAMPEPVRAVPAEGRVARLRRSDGAFLRSAGERTAPGPCRFRPGSERSAPGPPFELDRGVVEPEGVACEVRPPAPAAAHRPCDGPHRAADQGPPAATPGADRRQPVLHRADQHPRELAADVEDLVGAELPARRTMRAEVDERFLEGVLLPLLSAVAAHQLVERDRDHGADGEQQGLAPVAAAADRHVALFLPARRAVAHRRRVAGATRPAFRSAATSGARPAATGAAPAACPDGCRKTQGRPPDRSPGQADRRSTDRLRPGRSSALRGFGTG